MFRKCVFCVAKKKCCEFAVTYLCWVVFRFLVCFVCSVCVVFCVLCLSGGVGRLLWLQGGLSVGAPTWFPFLDRLGGSYSRWWVKKTCFKSNGSYLENWTFWHRNSRFYNHILLSNDPKAKTDRLGLVRTKCGPSLCKLIQPVTYAL